MIACRLPVGHRYLSAPSSGVPGPCPCSGSLDLLAVTKL